MQERGAEPAASERPDLGALSLRELATEIARKTSLLARREVALARTETREQLRAEVRMASGLGIAGVCALVSVQMLLVALVLGLAEAGVARGWLGALVVAAIVLAVGTVAGLVGWGSRVRQPLDATRRSARENVRWVKDRLA
jgi:hypothetical protein